MSPEAHEAAANCIEASMRLCEPADHEMLIEGAMLAGTHRVNALMHRLGATASSQDVVHSYLLTVNEFERLSVAHAAAIQSLCAIEKLRPAYVRGDWHGGPQAARDALERLCTIRAACETRDGVPRFPTID